MHSKSSNLSLRLTLIPLISFSFLELTTLPLRADTKHLAASHFRNTNIELILAELNLDEKNLRKKNVNDLVNSQKTPVQIILPNKASNEKTEVKNPLNNSFQDSTSSLSSETVLIPETSAIIVSFPSEISLDPNRKENFPISLPLVNPVLDSEGNVVIPAKSLVSARIRPMKGGDVIEVTSLVVGGRIIPINATGLMIPAQKKAEDFTNQYVPSPGRLNSVFTNLSNYQLSSAFLNQTSTDLNTYIGAGLALASGLTAPTPKTIPPRVSIPQGTVYILALASSVKIPKKLIQIDNNTSNSSKTDTNITPLKNDTNSITD